MSITDLADACEVGDTSVYRFCRTMKLQGYQEFKMKLSLSMSEKEEAKGVLGEAEDDDSLARKVMEVNMSAMRESYMLLDHHNLLKIVPDDRRSREESSSSESVTVCWRQKRLGISSSVLRARCPASQTHIFRQWRHPPRRGRI